MALAPSSPPDNPNYGQIFTKGVKYIKINKLDKDGEDYGPQLAIADSLNLNYPDIGSVQYDILTTQDQGGHYLFGVVANENTSSLNEIKDWDLTLVKSPMSKTLNAFDTVVFNNANDGGMFVVGGNSQGYYNDVTDVYTLNAPNIPVSVTSSITVNSLSGLGGNYFSLLVPTESIDTFQNELDYTQFEQLGIQVLNTIYIAPSANGYLSKEDEFYATSGGPCFIAGVYISFNGSMTLIQAGVEFNQGVATDTGDNEVIININPDVANFEYSDYNAILGNATVPQFSNTFQNIDYSSAQGLTPINFDLIISGSALKASIQDSNYSQTGWSNGRYNGSKVSSVNFNQ
jgi:hypothetical protein